MRQRRLVTLYRPPSCLGQGVYTLLTVGHAPRAAAGMEVPKYKTPVRSTDPNRPRKKQDRFNGLSPEELSKLTLPDHLAPGLDIVFVSAATTVTPGGWVDGRPRIGRGMRRERKSGRGTGLPGRIGWVCGRVC